MRTCSLRIFSLSSSHVSTEQDFIFKRSLFLLRKQRLAFESDLQNGSKLPQEWTITQMLRIATVPVFFPANVPNRIPLLLPGGVRMTNAFLGFACFEAKSPKDYVTQQNTAFTYVLVRYFQRLCRTEWRRRRKTNRASIDRFEFNRCDETAMVVSVILQN